MSNKKIGRYEILSTLGQGAMGVVYRANDPLLQRIVAIKTISLELSHDEFEEFERRFYREASSAGRLNHPNIVTIHDVGNTDSTAYMAMEFLEGVELRDILDGGGALEPERIADIVAQVADGLAFAHQHGVVHRDIKPSNIMILKNGVVKITDFGIALIPSSSRTVAGMILGSPKYMSPEQVVGQEVDGRADIFSLGVVLYEMLTGKPPFSGDNISALMYRILNEMPVPPREIRPELPETFDYIVARTLAKHPDDRYQNAADLANDLRHYLGLKVPENFLVLPDAKPRTLERRSRPRHGEDQTVVVPSLSVAPVPPRRAPGIRKILLLAAGAGVLAVTVWQLSRDPVPVTQELPPPVAPSQTAPEAAVQSPVQPVADTTVLLAVSPWGEVFVNDQREGVSPPLNELKLPAGSHKIEIRNPGFAPYRETVDLPAGSRHKIKHKFD